MVKLSLGQKTMLGTVVNACAADLYNSISRDIANIETNGWKPAEWMLNYRHRLFIQAIGQ